MNYPSRWALLIAVLLSLSLAAPAFGQDDADLDAREVVLQAVEKLAEGYRYTFEINLLQSFAGEDDAGFEVHNSQVVEGAMSARQDYHVTLAVQTGDSAQALQESPVMTMEQLSVDDVLYLNFQPGAIVASNPFAEVDPGWQSYDDLLAAYDEYTVTRVALESLANIPLPSRLPLTDAMIVAVAERDPETLDGTAMRVFEVEIDALQLMVSRTPGTLADRARMMLESADFFAKSDLSLVYTLWIGAEDGRLYRGESVGHTFLPYLTENEPGPPYDIEAHTRTTLTISQHGQVGDISLPEELR